VSPASAGRRLPDPRLPVRPHYLLRARAVWAIPLGLASVVAAVMTTLRPHPGTLATALGLLFWIAIGSVIVKWYDRRRLYRLHPGLLAAGNHGPFGKGKNNHPGRSLPRRP
jgi:hypothetical protein